MAQYSKEDWSEIEKLAEHATDTTYWTIGCYFCSTSSEKSDYPEGDYAFEGGFRVIKVSGDDCVFCKDCLANEKWKEWEKED